MPANSQTNQKLTMSAADVAWELGISRSCAYAVMRSRGFPSMRVGVKRIVCYRKDFEKWVAEKKMKQ